MIEHALPYILSNKPLEACLAHFNFEEFDVEKSIEEANTLLESSYFKHLPWKISLENLPTPSFTTMLPSIEALPRLELKQLPSSLKYAFLGPKDTLPVIISSSLSQEQESYLLEVLEKYKKAIG